MYIQDINYYRIPIRIIIIKLRSIPGPSCENTELSWPDGNYLTVTSELLTRVKHPWIIVYGHRPMYCTNKRDDCWNGFLPNRVGLPFVGMGESHEQCMIVYWCTGQSGPGSCCMATDRCIAATMTMTIANTNIQDWEYRFWECLVSSNILIKHVVCINSFCVGSWFMAWEICMTWHKNMQIIDNLLKVDPITACAHAVIN